MNYYNQPYYNAQYQPQQGGINWCQGEAAARAYMVAPGNTVLLMDSDASTFYIKSCDTSGMPYPLRIFDFTERDQATQPVAEEYITRKEFDALAAKIAALKEEPKDA